MVTHVHSLRATCRKWKANLQPVKLVIDGKVRRVKVSARALKPSENKHITKEGKSILPYYSSLFSVQQLLVN